MTKADITKEVSRSTGIDRETVAAVIESIMETIKGSVIQGEPVYLRGFGTFGIRHRAAKPARNITANTTVIIPESDVPIFKPCKGFKQAVNK